MTNIGNKKPNSLAKMLQSIDMFGRDLTIPFHSQTHIKTSFGGLVTILVYPCLIALFFYCVVIFEYSNNDVIFTSSQIYPYSNPNQGIQLNNEDGLLLDFKVYINSPDYDNDDNPYGKFRLHIFTNMDNYTDTSTDKSLGDKLSTFRDIEVPLELC